MALVRHDDRDPGAGTGARDPSANKDGGAAGRALEDAMITQQATSLVEGRICADPVDLIDDVVPEIARQDAVAEAAQQALAGGLSKKDAVVSVDCDDDEVWKNHTQKGSRPAQRAAAPNTANKTIDLADRPHQLFGQPCIGVRVSWIVILPWSEAVGLLAANVLELLQTLHLITIAIVVLSDDHLRA